MLQLYLEIITQSTQVNYKKELTTKSNNLVLKHNLIQHNFYINN
jgi:hypothetical protein